MTNNQPKMLMIVETDVDPDKEDDLNDWYNNEHIPEIVAVDGFVRARRYRAVDGQPRFIAMYEFDELRNRQTEDYARARGAKRMTPYLSNTKVRIYEKIFVYEKHNNGESEKG